VFLSFYAHQNLKMLFIDPDYRGKEVGETGVVH
jgi:hypothetical protein